MSLNIEIQTVMDFDQFKEFNFFHYTKKKKMIYYLSIFSFSTFFCIFSTPALLGFAIILSIILIRSFKKIAIAKYWHSSNLSKKCNYFYHLDGNKFFMESYGSSQSLPKSQYECNWNDFICIDETPDCFYFYSSIMEAFILPKKDFAIGNDTQLTKFLKEKLSLKYKCWSS
ncbi:MAG: YcxB family protein [Oligoflexia bacterium]|nr:YcxB family protein [Oligoflexia bacterium]